MISENASASIAQNRKFAGGWDVEAWGIVNVSKGPERPQGQYKIA